MSNRAVSIKQNDAKRIFKAALQAGFCSARIIIHPDGRIEASAALADDALPTGGSNSWDEVLR